MRSVFVAVELPCVDDISMVTIKSYMTTCQNAFSPYEKLMHPQDLQESVKRNLSVIVIPKSRLARYEE